jgi:O-antigen/teichoic acid export membrane protein
MHTEDDSNLINSPANLPEGETKGLRRLFQHSAIYSLSTSLQRLQGLIMTPIYTSTLYLPQLSDYSNYGLVYTFIAFMNFVYLYGMDSALLRYFFLGGKDRKTVFSTTFFVLLFSSFITTIIIFIFAPQVSRHLLFNPALSHFIQLAGIILILDSLGNLPFLILRAEERPVTFTIFRMVRLILELTLNIVFVVYLKKGIVGILYANIIAAFINLLIMLPFTLKYLTFSLNFQLLKDMMRFGLPFLPNGIAFMTIEMVDRFLVTKYLGKDTLALYHANYKFAAILLLLIIGFRNAWQPFFLKIAKDSQAPSLYARTLNYYLMIASIISIFVVFFIDDLLKIHFYSSFFILGEKYWPGIQYIPWIIISYLFYGIYMIFTPAFYITKKSKYMILFTGSGALINILFNIWLLPKIDIWGAVVATISAYFVMLVFIYIVAQKIYPIPLNYGKIISIIVLIGLAYVNQYLLHFSLTLRIIYFMAFIVFIWRFFLSENERKSLMDQIKLLNRKDNNKNG